MSPTDGRYEVHTWQVNGVYGLWWVPAGQRHHGSPDLIFGEDRLPLLAAAIAVAIKNPPTLNGPGPVPAPRTRPATVPLPPDPEGAA